MEISVIGISHRTAPVETREAFSLPPEQASSFLRAAHGEADFDEALVLDTCNRTEVYIAARSQPAAVEHVVRRICGIKGVQPPADLSAFYRFDGAEAVLHLFRVAASLESQIVGEHQVLGQVKDAYRLALAERTAGFLMHRLMHAAFRVGKRVQTQTQIGCGSASIAQAAVELAGVVFSSLEGKTVLFVGAGETARLAARAVLRAGAAGLIVANRTIERAREAAEEVLRQRPGEEEEVSCLSVRTLGAEAPGGRMRCPALLRMRPELAVPQANRPEPSRGAARPAAEKDRPAVQSRAITLDEIPAVIADVDLVISATGAQEPVLTYEKLSGPLRRLVHPLVIIDVAVPRDAEERLGKLSSVYLHNIDDLNCLVERNLQRRREEIPRAEAIVGDEVRKFSQWLDCLQLGPIIQLIQKHMEELQRAEIRRYGRKFADGDELARFTRSLCQKILHKPLAFLHQVAADGQDGESLRAMDFVRRMFDLDSVEGGPGAAADEDSSQAGWGDSKGRGAGESK